MAMWVPPGHSSILLPLSWPLGPGLLKTRQIPVFERFPVVSVIASSVRKGNVIEKEGKLYLVLTAENIHPGKGTPVTHLEMRRISDGGKTVERLRTTDSVEKAFIDQANYNFPYQDGEQYVFMQPETFDQVHVGLDVI